MQIFMNTLEFHSAYLVAKHQKVLIDGPHFNGLFIEIYFPRHLHFMERWEKKKVYGTVPQE